MDDCCQADRLLAQLRVFRRRRHWVSWAYRDLKATRDHRNWSRRVSRRTLRGVLHGLFTAQFLLAPLDWRHACAQIIEHYRQGVLTWNAHPAGHNPSTLPAPLR